MRIGKLFAAAKARKSRGPDGSDGPAEPGTSPAAPRPAPGHDDAHTIALGIVTPGRAVRRRAPNPPGPAGRSPPEQPQMKL